MFAAPWIVLGILQARILEWEAIPFSRGSNPGLLHCRKILYHLSHQGSHMPCCSLQWGFNKYEMKEFPQWSLGRTRGLILGPPMDTRIHWCPGPTVDPLCPWLHMCGFNQPDLVVLYYLTKKKNPHKWTCSVQIQVVFLPLSLTVCL